MRAKAKKSTKSSPAAGLALLKEIGRYNLSMERLCAKVRGYVVPAADAKDDYSNAGNEVYKATQELKSGLTKLTIAVTTRTFL